MALSVAQIEDLLDAAVNGRISLRDGPPRDHDPASALLREALCLAMLGASCRDYAALNPRGQVGRALREANQRLRRFT